MAHTRIHARLVLLGGVVTGALTVVWALAYLAGRGGADGIPLVALVLGPAAGIVVALAATCLAGHPASTAQEDAPVPSDSRAPAVPAGGTR